MIVFQHGQWSSTHSLTDAVQEFSSNKITYSLPIIISVSGSGATGTSTQGGGEIIITGRGFGPAFNEKAKPCGLQKPNCPGRGRLTGTAANVAAHYGATPTPLAKTGTTYSAECCRVESDERIVCQTAPGTGYGHSWIVRIGEHKVIKKTRHTHMFVYSFLLMSKLFKTNEFYLFWFNYFYLPGKACVSLFVFRFDFINNM